MNYNGNGTGTGTGTRLNSSSADDEYSMGDTSNDRYHHRKTLAKAHSLTTTATTSHRHAVNIYNGAYVEAEGENESDDETSGGDPEMWSSLNNNFQQVQSVLDRNRVLIQQVNENHQSKIHDNLVKNVALIQELNGNISKVASLYSDLSLNFCNTVHQRDGPPQSKSNRGKSGS